MVKCWCRNENICRPDKIGTLGYLTNGSVTEWPTCTTWKWKYLERVLMRVGSSAYVYIVNLYNLVSLFALCGPIYLLVEIKTGAWGQFIWKWNPCVEFNAFQNLMFFLSMTVSLCYCFISCPCTTCTTTFYSIWKFGCKVAWLHTLDFVTAHIKVIFSHFGMWKFPSQWSHKISSIATWPR
jgi:hypothetical protein